MKIALNYRVDTCSKDGVASPVETYARCVDRAFRALGHETTNVCPDVLWCPQDFDAYLELDNGRGPDGELGFGKHKGDLSLPTAIWLVDSHGHADLHRALAPYYDHVFFAVWDKRDLFTGHKSAHWCPNATDPQFFYPIVGDPKFDFGFFGSKGGLGRADKMIEICTKNGWSADVRQINGAFKHKWPYTCEAMNNCKVLFNHGQKHDGPNLRVLEAMAVGRPLISDLEPRSGMSKLFTEGEHYLSYESYTYAGLESVMGEALRSPTRAAAMADNARKLVLEKHLIKNRVEQMLEVFNATL